MLRAGLGEAAAGFGLPADEIADVVRTSPSMRPERHTVLSDPALTEDVIAAAVTDVINPPAP
jgi:hypothetical protein